MNVSSENSRWWRNKGLRLKVTNWWCVQSLRRELARKLRLKRRVVARPLRPEKEDRRSVAAEEKGWSPDFLQLEKDHRSVTAEGKGWPGGSIGRETAQPWRRRFEH
uniref:Uncharacterized protein n=1 Tax=Cucumis melo TaxID=3656 RepID=A0A9I9DN90_CUCME